MCFDHVAWNSVLGEWRVVPPFIIILMKWQVRIVVSWMEWFFLEEMKLADRLWHSLFVECRCESMMGVFPAKKKNRDKDVFPSRNRQFHPNRLLFPISHRTIGYQKKIMYLNWIHLDSSNRSQLALRRVGSYYPGLWLFCHIFLTGLKLHEIEAFWLHTSLSI